MTIFEVRGSATTHSTRGLQELFDPDAVLEDEMSEAERPLTSGRLFAELWRIAGGQW